MMPPDSPPVAVPAPDIAGLARQRARLVALFVAFAKMALRRLRRGAGLGAARHRRSAPMDDSGRVQRDLRAVHFLPGPNVVNLSVVFGSRFRGIPGASRPLPGCSVARGDRDRPRGALCRYGEIDALRAHFGRVSCAAVGLLISALFR